MSLKVSNWRLQPHLPGTHELSYTCEAWLATGMIIKQVSVWLSLHITPVAVVWVGSTGALDESSPHLISHPWYPQQAHNQPQKNPITPANQRCYADSKVRGANMGLIWGHQDTGGPHVLCYLGTHVYSKGHSHPIPNAELTSMAKETQLP